MRVTRVLCLFLVISFFLFSQWCEIPYADDSLHTGHESLIDEYHQIKKKLEKSSLTIPFYLESSVSNNASRVDIYGTIKYPFDIVENELQLPTNWCDIVLLHSDVRACTYKKVNDTWLLTLYNVKKFQDPLKDAYPMNFEYRVIAQQPGFFALSLAAREWCRAGSRISHPVPGASVLHASGKRNGQDFFRHHKDRRKYPPCRHPERRGNGSGFFVHVHGSEQRAGAVLADQAARIRSKQEVPADPVDARRS